MPRLHKHIVKPEREPRLKNQTLSLHFPKNISQFLSHT